MSTSPTSSIESTSFIVKETADFEDSDGAGAYTLQPGEKKTLAEYEVLNNMGFLLALGATDHSDVTYELHVDNERKFKTRSPLGLVNDPYSLRNELGFVYPAERLIQYKAVVDSDASSSKTMAARLYVTEEDL